MRSNTKLALVASLAMLSDAQHTYNQHEIPQIDRSSPLVPMSQYVPPNDLDGHPDLFYPTDYRILNCWDCFQAQGKVCMEEGHNSLYFPTGSSDPGNVFCCAPDATDEFCIHGSSHTHEGVEEDINIVCSEPSYGAASKWRNILTDNRNQQMFAFCPTINHQKCGVTHTESGDSHDMRIKAGMNRTHVQSNDMKYKKANAQDLTREYDSCYYEISFDESVLDQYVPQRIHVQISAKVDMNVYLYGGQSRFQAYESIIAGNEQAQVGMTYSIPAYEGMLLVAYPNENVQTEFGFNYWLEAELKSAQAVTDESPISTNSYPEDEVDQVQANIYETSLPFQNPISVFNEQAHDDYLFYGLCAAAGLIMIAIVVLCVKCRKQGKIQHVNSIDPVFGSGNHTSEREASMHLEEMDDEQESSNRPSLQKGSVFENDNEKRRNSEYKKVNAASTVDVRQ